MKKLVLYFLWLPFCVVAQNPGRSNIILFSLSKAADSTWRADAPRFLTAFNIKGYNNQPSFFDNNQLWFSAQLYPDTSQTDIFALDLLLKTRTQVTATAATAEYSPTLMPGGKRFSAVRVEEDGNQRLWSFPIDRSDNGQPEFPRIYNVGYYCWLRDTLAVLFIVGENGQPHSLFSVGLKGQKPMRIAGNIGRCLIKRPDGKLLFVQKPTEQTWFLKTWDPSTNAQEIVAKIPFGTEDFTLLSDGTMLCGQGPKLLQFNPRRDADWREIADLSRYNISKVTRLAASKDGKLAVVVH